MRCPSCGNEIPEGKRFCGHCGHRLDVPPAPEGFDDDAPTRLYQEPAQPPRPAKPAGVRPQAPRLAPTPPPPVRRKPPPVYQPPSSAPKRGVPGWIWVLGGALIGLCLIAAVVITVIGQMPGRGATPATLPPIATSSPEVDLTVAPTVSTTAAPGDCILDADYVADVTVPDDTVFAPGAAFVKTWRIRNSGTCDWGSGFNLVFVQGDLMNGGEIVPIPATSAGGTVDVSVNLVAPTAPGTYQGHWQLQSPEGSQFGRYATYFVRIVVSESAETAVVPNVIGMDQQTAVKTLEEAGFAPFVIERAIEIGRGTPAPAWTIVEQTTAGQTLPLGSEITIVLGIYVTGPP